LVTSPHEDTIFLVYRQFFGVDEFVFEPLDIVVIDIETQFESSIGHSPFTLEQRKNLGEDVIEGHKCPSARLVSPF
jgi:hypothetical protein